jgi:8-oxo-dGTP diphosphatase
MQNPRQKKTLILLRHAHRDTDAGRELDNGLSPKGQEQAKLIQSLFNKERPGETARLISSPKLRCRETLAPLAKALRVPVEEEPLLLEGGDGTPPGLDQKIDLFFADWVHRKDPLTVACSHGDWIPEFLARYATIQTDVKKRAWAELDWDPTFSETRLTLRALHQRLG